jgi:hypothetical protein
MAGATDPSIAAALEDQARSLKMQVKTLDSTQKLLQWIYERFDEQDVRWWELEQTVATNASDLSTLQAKVDATDLEHMWSCSRARPGTVSTLSQQPQQRGWRRWRTYTRCSTLGVHALTLPCTRCERS